MIASMLKQGRAADLHELQGPLQVGRGRHPVILEDCLRGLMHGLKQGKE